MGSYWRRARRAKGRIRLPSLAGDRKLEAAASPEELMAFLAAELEDHFGAPGDAEGIAKFVARARSWFDTCWKGTRV